MIREILLDKKGMKPVVLDVEGLSTVTDFFVIASGTSPPHLKALGAEVENRMKTGGVKCVRTAGTPSSGWVILDYLGVVVHLFLDEIRQYYALEQLWRDAPQAG